MSGSWHQALFFTQGVRCRGKVKVAQLTSTVIGLFPCMCFDPNDHQVPYRDCSVIVETLYGVDGWIQGTNRYVMMG